MAQQPIIETIDGSFVVVRHIYCFKRHDRADGQPGKNLWAVTPDALFLVIEDTCPSKEQQLFENIGFYSCTDDPIDNYDVY